MPKLYEENRKDAITDARKIELIEISKMLEVPADIEKIENIDLLRGD